MRTSSKGLLTVAAAGLAVLAALAHPAAGGAPGGQSQLNQLSPEQKVSFIQSVVLIGSTYREWSRAYTSKDSRELARWLDRHCTPDFTFKALDGRSQSRKDVQARLAESLPALRTASPAVARPERIAVLKETATVMVSFRYADTATDSSGRSISHSGQRFTRDTWVRQGEGWLLQRSEELREIPPLPRTGAAPAAREAQRPGTRTPAGARGKTP